MADRRVRSRIDKSFDVPSPNSENGRLAEAIADGRTWSEGLVFIQNVGHTGQDLQDFVDVLSRKLDREGVGHDSVFDMYTAVLLSALWEDINAGEFTSQFYGGASNVSSGSLSVNSSAQSGANEDAGNGLQLSYYVAIQGEGEARKLHVLLRVGDGSEVPDKLWTYSFS